jgi:hypothetical protein
LSQRKSISQPASKDRDKDETMEFIAKGLMELGNYAKASGTNGIDGNTWRSCMDT